MASRDDDSPRWTFLTNHGHVLLCLARSPGITLRDVAARVGVTERAVQRIVADLEGAGYLQRRRSGRQNEYDIDPEQPLRHPVEAHQRVQALIDLATTRSAPVRASARAAKAASRPVRRGH
ncbi:MAG: MarR family transcriptional regulator [Vicinamibacterales bacterium]